MKTTSHSKKKVDWNKVRRELQDPYVLGLLLGCFAIAAVSAAVLTMLFLGVEF